MYWDVGSTIISLVCALLSVDIYLRIRNKLLLIFPVAFTYGFIIRTLQFLGVIDLCMLSNLMFIFWILVVLYLWNLRIYIKREVK